MRILKISVLALGLLAMQACGQKGQLCMPEPLDGSKLPAHVPVCTKR